MTTDQALLKIAASTADAVSEALRVFCGSQVSSGSAKVVAEEESPLADLALPAVVTRVAYVDGVTGGNLFTMPLAGARHLAAAMMGADPPTDEETELDEIELSAVGEAMNQMMSAAAQAVGKVLGQEIEIGPPETRLVALASEADDLIQESGAHASCVDFTVMGAPCRLVQLVPHAFVVRVTRAMDEILTEHDGEPLKAALRDIPVRVWVELGRARMPMGRFVALPPGEVVELDRDVSDPVDLYVDGMHVARGRLVVSDDGASLALDIESVIGAPDAAIPNPEPQGVNA
jgi:flagellar motor switch protein FliN/FliY